MKKALTLLALGTTLLTAHAQSLAVRTSANGTLTEPTSLWSANAAAISSALGINDASAGRVRYAISLLDGPNDEPAISAGEQEIIVHGAARQQSLREQLGIQNGAEGWVRNATVLWDGANSEEAISAGDQEIIIGGPERKASLRDQIGLQVSQTANGTTTWTSNATRDAFRGSLALGTAATSNATSFVASANGTATNLTLNGTATLADNLTVNGIITFTPGQGHVRASRVADSQTGTTVMLYDGGWTITDPASFRSGINLGTLATQNGTAPTGTIVGTNDAQTLSNKTLISPLIRPQLVTSAFTAANGGRYILQGTALVTDPATTSGGYYEVVVASGTATIGGVSYLPSRFPVVRTCDGTTWTTRTNYLSSDLTIDNSTFGSNLALTGSTADARYPLSTTTITAGTGLSGGGNLTANRTLTLNATIANLNNSTSSQLAGVLTDETGTGAAVFGTNATLTGATLNGTTTTGAVNSAGQVTVTGVGGVLVNAGWSQGLRAYVPGSGGINIAPRYSDTACEFSVDAMGGNPSSWVLRLNGTDRIYVDSGGNATFMSANRTVTNNGSTVLNGNGIYGDALGDTHNFSAGSLAINSSGEVTAAYTTANTSTSLLTRANGDARYINPLQTLLAVSARPINIGAGSAENVGLNAPTYANTGIRFEGTASASGDYSGTVNTAYVSGVGSGSLVDFNSRFAVEFWYSQGTNSANVTFNVHLGTNDRQNLTDRGIGLKINCGTGQVTAQVHNGTTLTNSATLGSNIGNLFAYRYLLTWDGVQTLSVYAGRADTAAALTLLGTVSAGSPVSGEVSSAQIRFGYYASGPSGSAQDALISAVNFYQY